MLSALVTENQGDKSTLLGVDRMPDGDVLDLTGFGVASLSEQTEFERAYAPLPSPSGQMLHDPDFSLTTTAGQIPWRLFHYSNQVEKIGAFGYGRRASWPLRLCVEQTVPPASASVSTATMESTESTDGQGAASASASNVASSGAASILTVTLEREDGQGVVYASTDGGTSYTPVSPRLFDTLTGNPSTGFVETRRDSGTAFHYPSGGFASLSYFETVFGKRVTFHYDSSQRLASIEEPAGRAINLGYNGEGLVNAVTDWANRTHEFAYTNGDLQTVWDPEGYVTTFASDDAHRIAAITAPTGFVTSFTYDTANRIATRSVDGNVGRYTYAQSNAYGVDLTVSYIDPFGKVWKTDLDAFGNVVQVVDPIGATRKAVYNAKGQYVNLRDGLNRLTIVNYDPVTGHEINRTDPGIYRTYRTYDSYANLITDTDPLGFIHRFNYGADPSQRLVRSATDPLGQVTTYSYTNWGALATIRTPLNSVTTYTWDDNTSLLQCETDPLGFIRTYQYDAAGNRILERDEAGKDTTYTYDALGRQTSRTDPLGNAQQTIYDGVGNVTVRVDALDHRTTYSYNAFNEEIEEWDARGFRHTTLYDAKGRETGRIDPNGHLTQSVYDFADNRIAQIDALGRRTTTQYDLARRPVTLIDTTGLAYVTEYEPYNSLLKFTTHRSPSGQRTTSVYDEAGQLVASVDTVGLRTTFVYDRVGQLQTTIEPTGARTTTSYDAEGRSIGIVDALGRRATSIYDRRGQLTVSQDAEGKRYTTMYDGRGLRTAEYSPDGTFVLRDYDDAGRAIGTADHLDRSTATQYDALGQVQAFRDEWSRKTADEYNPVGLVYQSRDYLGKVSTITHDPARRVEAYVNPQNNVTSIGYDASNAVTMIWDGLPGSNNADDLPVIDFFSYDEFGRFKVVANTKGERTTTGYDNFGRVSYEMDADGQQTGFIYDGFGRWAAQQDADGYRVTTNFDPYGRQVGYTDELGYTTTFTLDLLDRPIAEIDPDGSVTTFSYDEVSRVIGRTDPLGVSATTVYDKRGNVSAQVDALGYRTTYYYDPFSRNISVENALGYRTSSSYDSLGRVNATTNARGYATTTLFDALSRPEATQNALGQLSTTVYDVFGRAYAHVDALGYRTSTVYDARGRVIGQIDALGYRTTTLYDNVGRSWASVDALGRRTTTLYDSVGRVTGQVSPLGYVTTTLYDNRGNAKAQMDARGYLTSYGYDARGQQIWQKDALGFVTTSVYDGMGRMVAGVDAFGYRTTTTYDLRGQVKTRQDALGVVTTSLYDVLGRSLGQVDALGRTTTSVYDPLGRTIAVVNPLNERMSMVYDEVGNRLAVVNALGYTTSYSYDILDRQEGWMDPLGRRHTLAFDAVGRVRTQMDAKGQVTSHSYNGRGEETFRLYADGQTVSTVYDAAGQTLGIWDTAGVFTYGYDGGGRLQSVLGPDYPGRVPVTYSYDGSGNRVGMASWWGLFTYGYDARGQMAMVQDPGAYYEYVDGGTTSFFYDARGQKVGQINANGTSASMVYDTVGRLLQTRTVGPDILDRLEVARASYAYDAVGRPLVKDTNLVRHTYSYDALDRLIGEEISGLIGQTDTGGSTTPVYDARAEFRYDASATSASGAWQYGWATTLTADFVLDSGPALPSVTGGTAGVFGYGVVTAAPVTDGITSLGDAAGLATTQYTMGYMFTLTAPVLVTDLGYFDYHADGLGEAHEVGIYDASGALLFSATVPSGTAGTLGNTFTSDLGQGATLNGFRYVALDTPRVLPAGSYTIGGYTGTSGLDVYSFGGSSTSTSAPVVIGVGVQTLTFLPALSTTAPTDNTAANSFYGPSFQFEALSEAVDTREAVTGFGANGPYSHAFTGSNYTSGYTFSLPESITVTELGYLAYDYQVGYNYQGGGLGEAHEVGIYDSTGALLFSATVPSGTAGTMGDIFPVDLGQGDKPSGFRYVALTTPQTLPAGDYTVAAFGGTLYRDNFAVEMGSVFVSAPVVYGLGVSVSLSGGLSPTAPPNPSNLTAPNSYFAPGFRFTVATHPQGLPVVLANDGPSNPAVFGGMSLPESTLLLHPGDKGNVSVVRFVAPASGSYTLDGAFSALQSGTNTSVRVVRVSDGSVLFSATQTGASGPQPFHLTGVSLSEGEAIDFRVGSAGSGYANNATGLTVQVTAPSAGEVVWGSRRTTWTYDGAGRRTTQQVTDNLSSSGVTTYAYDAADELLTTEMSGGKVTTFGYDANGSRLYSAQPSGHVTSYTWDGANRLQTLRLPSGGITTQVYGSDGLRHAQVLPSSRGGGVEVSLWDEASSNSGGNLAPLSWKGRFAGNTASLVGSDTTTQGNWQSVYGADGFLLAMAGETVPNADSLRRFSHVDFGAADGQLWQASTTDARALQKPGSTDRIAAAYRGNSTLVVDVNLPDERPHIVHLYLLDWDNVRAGALTITDADTNVTLYSQSLGSYSNGRWLSFRLTGHVHITLTNTTVIPVSVGGVTTYVNPGAVISGVFFDGIPVPSNGTVDLLAQVFNQAPSGQGDELLTASGSTRRNVAIGRQYHEDALGTVEATTQGGVGNVGGDYTGVNGSPIAAFATDAWGNVLSEQVETKRGNDDNPFLYLGGLGYWQEPNLGLTYVRARWLDTGTGQWISVDPVDGEPRYSYAYNSPTMRVDPSGQLAIPLDLTLGTLGTLLPAQIQKEFTKIQHRLLQEGNHAVSIANHALQSLIALDQQAVAQWEHARADMPAFLANIAPPSPLDIPGSFMWRIGMITGSFQALFNLIPILPLIPDFIAFIQYMVKNTKGLAGILPTIGEYIKEQWNGIVALFTQHQDMSPFQRGLLFGNLFVSVIIAIIGIILAFLTAGGSLAVVIEEEGANFAKIAGRLAKAAGRRALRAPGNAARGAVRDLKAEARFTREAYQSIKQKQLTPELQKPLDRLTQMASKRQMHPDELQARAKQNAEDSARKVAGDVSEGKEIRITRPNPPYFTYQHTDPTCVVAVTDMVLQHYGKPHSYGDIGLDMKVLNSQGNKLPKASRAKLGPQDIADYLNSHGVSSSEPTFSSPGGADLEILKLADKSRPIVVYVKSTPREVKTPLDILLRRPGKLNHDVNHVVIVDGVDFSFGEPMIAVRDPAEMKPYFQDADSFIKKWRQVGGLYVLPHR